MNPSFSKGWYIAGEEEGYVDKDHYDEFEELFSIRVHHGGFFTETLDRVFVFGKVHYVHCVHRNDFNLVFMKQQILEQRLGYQNIDASYLYYKIPGKTMEENLHTLAEPRDVSRFLEKTEKFRLLEVYVSTQPINTTVRPRSDRLSLDRVQRMQLDFSERLEHCPPKHTR